MRARLSGKTRLMSVTWISTLNWHRVSPSATFCGPHLMIYTKRKGIKRALHQIRPKMAMMLCLKRQGRFKPTLKKTISTNIDTEIEQVAAGLGLADLGYDHDVSKLSGGQRSKIILAKLLLQSQTFWF